MREYLMLLSLPNTGSDWLAENMALCHNGQYRREYFNPICHMEIEPKLKLAFGCEGKYYRNIANFNLNTPTVYHDTWEKDRFTFTKENFSQFKVDFFANYFNCIVLFRRPENSFPYMREEVGSWFDAMYNSLSANYGSLDIDVKKLLAFAQSMSANNTEKRIYTYMLYYYVLFKSASRNNIPIIKYEDLVNCSSHELLYVINKIPMVDHEKLCDLIIKTRKIILKQNDFTEMANSFAMRMPAFGEYFINNKYKKLLC